MSDIILSCQNLAKTFNDGKLQVKVFDQLNLDIRAKDTVAIIGSSGAGKSTLLQLLGGLEQPSAGQVLINDQNIHQLNEKMRSAIRNQSLGFVYQFHHLLPEFTALENVCMPLLIAGESVQQAAESGRAIIAKMGLSQRLNHKPAELSGGEKQRVAIARALINQPACVLADEPTGNLDTHTASHVFDWLLTINQQVSTALIIVTHDEKIAQRMDKVYHLRDGCCQLIES